MPWYLPFPCAWDSWGKPTLTNSSSVLVSFGETSQIIIFFFFLVLSGNWVSHGLFLCQVCSGLIRIPASTTFSCLLVNILIHCGTSESQNNSHKLRTDWALWNYTKTMVCQDQTLNKPTGNPAKQGNTGSLMTFIKHSLNKMIFGKTLSVSFFKWEAR